MTNWEMDAEGVLQCFQFLWFSHSVFNPSPRNPGTNITNIPKSSSEKEPMSLQVRTVHPLPSPVDDHKNLSVLPNPEPNPAAPPPDREPETRSVEITCNGLKQRKMRRKGRIEERERAAELEFQELKGLMELGLLNFGSAVEDERLVSIVPGLQRGRRRGEGNYGGIYRPYLSDAWLCRIPFESEVCHREGLRSWAHAVACSVK